MIESLNKFITLYSSLKGFFNIDIVINEESMFEFHCFKDRHKNKITHTDFLTEPEIIKIEKYLNSIQCKNYFTFGGYEESNRKMIFFYPEKMNSLFGRRKH